MIREYFDHYKMDYTQSVYMPEVALQHSKNFKECQNKPELMKKAGLDASDANLNDCVMVQVIKKMIAQQKEIERLNQELERAKQSSGNKNKFKNS